MPEITLTLGQDGRLCGLTNEDEAHLRRWHRRLESLRPGQNITFSWSEPRSGVFHRRHFAVLNEIYDNQEIFTSRKEFREWTERGARHVMVLEHGGVEYEIAKSISYDSLDDAEFLELHQRVKAFLLSHKALRKLWPHAEVGNAYQAVLFILESQR